MCQRSVLAVLLIASGIAAQSSTSPAGLDLREGNTTFWFWSSSQGTQLRGYDATLPRRARLIRSVAFRRDGQTRGYGAARTLDVVLSLAETPLDVLDAQLLTALPRSIVVFNKTKVSFPDWSAPTPVPPAKFDFVLPLTRSFVYRGNAALAWDLRYRNPSVTSPAAMDREYMGPRGMISGVVEGGCRSFGHELVLENNGPGSRRFGMRMRVYALGAPPNSQGWLFLDFRITRTLVPGFCAAIRAFPTIQIPFRVTSAGFVEMRYFSFPYLKAAEGALFVTQMLAIDPGARPVPLRISDARVARMPANDTPGSLDAVYAWAPLGVKRSWGMWHYWGGAPVLQIR